MSYNFLNNIYRAIDSYTHSYDFNIDQQIHGVRVLLENQNFRQKCQYIPTETDLLTRLQQLRQQLNGNNQNVREINDIYLTMGIGNIDNEYERFRNVTTINNSANLKSIASDKHNVHNSAINNSIKEIAINLVGDFPVQDNKGVRASIVAKLERRNGWGVKARNALDFIYESKVHFNINITLQQMLESLFKWILTHKGEVRDDLVNRLVEELVDMSGQCSTGHMSRIINVLQGYTDNERYILGIDVEKELRKTVKQMITTNLRNAPEDVIDGIIDRTDDYKKYIDAFCESMMSKWLDEFGEEHIPIIEEIIQEFKQ